MGMALGQELTMRCRQRQFWDPSHSWVFLTPYAIVVIHDRALHFLQPHSHYALHCYLLFISVAFLYKLFSKNLFYFSNLFFTPFLPAHKVSSPSLIIQLKAGLKPWMKTSHPHSLPAWEGIGLLAGRVLRNPRNVVGLPLVPYLSQLPWQNSSGACCHRLDRQQDLLTEHLWNGKTRHCQSQQT